MSEIQNKLYVNEEITTKACPFPCTEFNFAKTSVLCILRKSIFQMLTGTLDWKKSQQNFFTINSTRRIFRDTRLQQGLKNAAAIFQQVMEETLKGLTGCVAY